LSVVKTHKERSLLIMEEVKKEKKWRFSSFSKKSKFIITAALIVIIGLGIAGSYYYHQTVVEKKIASFQEKDEYKGISGLSYQILQIKQSNNQAPVVMDIVSKKPIPSKTVSTFEKELFQRLKSNHISTSHITIHVFNQTSQYQKAVKEGYKGRNGLIQTIISDRSSSKPIIRSILYEEINETQQGDIDAVVYNIENAKKHESQATIEIVVSGDHSEVRQFVSPFTQLIKQLNPHLNNITLKIYSSYEDFNKKEPTWVYRNNLLTFEQTLSTP